MNVIFLFKIYHFLYLKKSLLVTEIEEFRLAIGELEKSNSKITEIEAAVIQLQAKTEPRSNQMQNSDNTVIELENSSNKKKEVK